MEKYRVSHTKRKDKTGTFNDGVVFKEKVSHQVEVPTGILGYHAFKCRNFTKIWVAENNYAWATLDYLKVDNTEICSIYPMQSWETQNI